MSGQGNRHVAKVRCKDLVNLETQRQYDGIGGYSTFPFYLSGTAGGRYLTTAFLPRLSQVGSIFSRWRVKTACVHYQSLASANTLGSVGVGLDRDYSEPVSVAELASIPISAVSPVWQSASTPMWRALADTWYAVKDVDSDPPLYIHILNFASITDGATSQGLFWLEVEIEFTDLTASFQDSLSFVQYEAYSLSPTGAVIPWQYSNNHSGFWDWAADKAINYVTGATEYNTARGAPVGIDGNQYIEWFGDFLLDAAALPDESGVDAKWTDVDDEKSVCGGRGVRLRRPRFAPGLRRHPVGLPVASGVNTVYATSSADAKPGRLVTRALAAKPYVAGDVVCTLYFQPLGGPELVALYSTTFSPGTGATEVLAQWSGYITTPGHAFISLLPDGTETRDLLAGSSMSIEVVGRETSS
jgi:hypothetical protein